MVACDGGCSLRALSSRSTLRGSLFVPAKETGATFLNANIRQEDHPAFADGEILEHKKALIYVRTVYLMGLSLNVP